MNIQKAFIMVLSILFLEINSHAENSITNEIRDSSTVERFNMIRFLLNEKTTNSQSVLLDLLVVNDDDLITTVIIEGLRYTKIDVDVSPEAYKRIESNIFEAQRPFGVANAIRMVGNLQRVDPEQRTDSLLKAFKAVSDWPLDRSPIEGGAITAKEYALRQIVFAFEDIGPRASVFLNRPTLPNIDPDYIEVARAMAGDEIAQTNILEKTSESTAEIRILSIFSLKHAVPTEANILKLKTFLHDPIKYTYEVHGESSEQYPIREAAAIILTKWGYTVKLSESREFIFD